MIIRKSKFYEFAFPNQWEEIETYTTIYGHYNSIKRIKYYFRGIRINKKDKNNYE